MTDAPTDSREQASLNPERVNGIETLNSNRPPLLLSILSLVVSAIAVSVSVVSRCDANRSATAADKSASIAESSYVRSSRVFEMEHRPDLRVVLDEDRLKMTPDWRSLQFCLTARNTGPGPAESCRVRLHVNGIHEDARGELAWLGPEANEPITLTKLAWQRGRPDSGTPFTIQLGYTWSSPYTLQRFSRTETLQTWVVFIGREDTTIILRIDTTRTRAGAY